jgi:hypothetical protein
MIGTAQGEERGGGAAGAVALVIAVGAATVAAAVAVPVPGFAAVPVLLAGLLYATARLPLRLSAAALLFLVLALEVSTDAAGLWCTPLARLGDLLQDNLERSAGLPGVALSGLELAAMWLLGVAALRRRNARDHAGAVRTPGVVVGLMALYVAGVVWAEAIGIAKGAPVAIWKAHQLLQLPLLAVLFQVAFRGPRDHSLVAGVVIAAAAVKALLAVWVQRVVAPELTGGKLAFATSHGDSVLFAVAAVILLGAIVDGRGPRRLVVLAPLLLLVVVGIKENERRTAWVMLAMAAAFAYAVGAPRPWKRAVTRAAVIAVPLLALYLAVGWDREGGIFAPIRAFRTLSDTTDSSTRWREIENWNIAMSMREAPVLGIGLGGVYTEYVKGDDISALFTEFRAWPHNSVLGLLLFAGPLGFVAIWALPALVVFLAVRSHRAARRADDRTAALACVATVIACAVLAFGDTGTHFVQYRLLLALAVAISGKLAVATGAWPAPVRTARQSARAGVGGGPHSS